MLPDGGRNYLSKLYNDEWMRASGMLPTAGSLVRVADVLAERHHPGALPALVLARTTQRVGEAIETLQTYGISQLPVSEAPTGDAVESIVGAISETGLLERAYRDPAVVERTVGEIMDAPLPMVDASAVLDEAFAHLTGGAPAAVVVDDRRPIGVVTRLDLLEYLAHRRAGG